MTERSHLSIGEVLSLLREEFPDVTISKIRFLESQGLVDPERTPSGYRKFYDHDVERLRWILRQQRENYLPLKIIRGRLTEQGDEVDDNGPGNGYGAGYGGEADRRAGTSDEVAGSSTGSPAADLERTIEDAAVTHPSAGPRQAGSPAHTPAPPAPVMPATTGASRPVGTTRPPGGGSAPSVPSGPPGAGAGPAAVRATEAPGPDASSSDSAVARGSDQASARGAPGLSPGRSGSGLEEAAAVIAGRARAAAPAGIHPAPEDTETYSIDELASASGGTVAMVKELQEFGLISTGTVVGGTPFFDATALAVARAAAGFSRYGVDARHLRAWRNAADREAGLFEQVIMPLLRQRNPDARRQAADTLLELTTLGGDLRKALLDRAVRQIH